MKNKRICKSEGCSNPYYARGYCRKHYKFYLRKGLIKKKNKVEKVKHGYEGTPIYVCWCNMKARCSNPNLKEYKNYGGKGIKVCEQWEASFESFLADMGERPGKEYSLDRIDPDKDYCPENCRWTITSVQSHNKVMDQVYEYNGKRLTLSQWIDEIKTNGKNISNGLVKFKKQNRRELKQLVICF